MPVSQRREDGIETFVVFTLVKNLLASKLVYLLQYLAIRRQVSTHSDKGIHNTNAHIYRR